MRHTFQQRAFTAAISAVLATAATGLTGCDQSSTPDGKAATSIRNGDYQAAAKEKGASPANIALAAKGAASEQYAASLPVYAGLADQQVAISQKLWQIGRLSLTAQRMADSAGELNKYKPDAALAEIDKTVTLVRGEGQQGWTVAEDVTLPTATTMQAKANELKDKIAEIQRTLAGLKQTHTEAVANARQLQEQSKDAKGEQSVALFRQSVDTRKRASELATQIEQAEASLVSLEQDLAVAESQTQQYVQTIEQFAGQRDVIEKSWRGVSAQIEQRNAYAGQVYARTDDPKFGSVTLKAQELAQLSEEYAKQSQAYQQQLDGASSLARDAVSNAEKALKDIPREQAGGKGVTPAKLAQTALNAAATRVLQGQIQYTMGTELSVEAGLAALQARVAENVAQLGATLGQPVPESMNEPARAKLKTEQGELVTKAGDVLKGAGELFDTAMQARDVAPETKRTATVGKMVALAGSARVMQTAGDAATAKLTLDEARGLRDSLLQGGALPSLPETLQGSAPAKPAGAVEQ